MAQEVTGPSGPQSMNIWLDSLRSTAQAASQMTETERTVSKQKDDAILILLGKLALNYWRPDFTASQARELYSQYLEDLRPWPFQEIVSALKKYRQSGEKFFPTSGQLVRLITAVPNWDVISAEKHRGNLRYQAKAETQDAILLLGGGSLQKQIT